MTPEQRYMMDAQGFVILRGAMSDAEVEAGRAVSWLCRHCYCSSWAVAV
jgi:hypothetical protein